MQFSDHFSTIFLQNREREKAQRYVEESYLEMEPFLSQSDR